ETRPRLAEHRRAKAAGVRHLHEEKSPRGEPMDQAAKHRHGIGYVLENVKRRDHIEARGGKGRREHVAHVHLRGEASGLGRHRPPPSGRLGPRPPPPRRPRPPPPASREPARRPVPRRSRSPRRDNVPLLATEGSPSGSSAGAAAPADASTVSRKRRGGARTRGHSPGPSAPPWYARASP